MKALNILTIVSVLVVSTLSASAYKEVKCSSDPDFTANSCSTTDQCFIEENGKGEGSNFGFLKDEWINSSTSDKILYKVEQEMPSMKNLSPSLVEWNQKPSSKNFWEYTDEFEKYYDEENEGYVLPKGKKVIWLKSKKGVYFELNKNKAPEGKNIGLLVYKTTTHDIEKDGTISTNSREHKECVLYKSGKKVEKAPVIVGKKTNAKTPAKKLPKTGPEHYVLLLLLAMILGFGVMKMRNKA